MQTLEVFLSNSIFFPLVDCRIISKLSLRTLRVIKYCSSGGDLKAHRLSGFLALLPQEEKHNESF